MSASDSATGPVLINFEILGKYVFARIGELVYHSRRKELEMSIILQLYAARTEPKYRKCSFRWKCF